MVREWIAARGLHVLNPEGPTHRDGGVIDLALGPARAFAEFAHWASDHRALVISVPSRPSSLLPPPKRLPKAHFEEAAHLLRSFLPPARLTSTPGRSSSSSHGMCSIPSPKWQAVFRPAPTGTRREPPGDRRCWPQLGRLTPYFTASSAKKPGRTFTGKGLPQPGPRRSGARYLDDASAIRTTGPPSWSGMEE